jgi:hypothetical protein
VARRALCPPESDMKVTGGATRPWRDDKDCDEGANWEMVKDTELAVPGFCESGADDDGDDDDGGDDDGDDDSGDDDNGGGDNGDDAEAALEVG